MRLNFTPFIDLFSILAIGLLLIMTVTSGTDVTSDAAAAGETAVVEFYPGVPRSALVVRPAYFLTGEEMEMGRLPAVVREREYENRIEVWMQGTVDDIEVGFRVAEVRDSRLVDEEIMTRFVKIYQGEEVRECRQRIGRWRDPAVCVGSSCIYGCEE